MKCLVTGAAGFLGSHLCERLINDGHTVIGIDDLSNGKLSNLESIKQHNQFHFLNSDICNLKQNYCADVDWVFHLAGKADIVPSIEFPKRYHDVNVAGTLEMLEFAKTAKVKRFIYAASSSCYGIPNSYPTLEIEPARPQYPYALTKWIGENYVCHWNKVYGLPTISLRLFNVYGPRHRTSGAYGAVFGVFLSQLAHGAPLTVVGTGEQKRDFTYVTDVVDAFVKAAESDQTGIFNIGTGQPQSINLLARLLSPINESMVIRHIPDRPGEPQVTQAEITRARLFLNWAPIVSFEEGVKIMKAQVPLYKDAPLWTPETIEKATKTWFDCLGEKA